MDIISQNILYSYGDPKSANFDWTVVFASYDVPESLIEEYINYITPFYLSDYALLHNVSNDFMYKYLNKFSSTGVYRVVRGSKKNITNRIIDKYITNNLTFRRLILSNKRIKEKVLRKYSLLFNKTEWETLSLYQKLSKQFIIDYFEKLSLKNLLYNKNISEETKTYIRMFI